MVWKIIGGVIGLILIGFIKQALQLRRLVKDINFLRQYRQNYVKYCNDFLGKNIHSEEEGKLFFKLISDAPKAQRLLLSSGLIDYKPAGAGYYVRNYPVLTNTIQLLRDPFLTKEEVNMLNNIIIMQDSLYNELFEEIKREVVNPFVLLREGVQFFVTLPISLMYWTGLIEYSTLNKVSNYFIVKLLNFLIIIIGFLSAIVTLVTGWEPFIKIANKFM
ncbi:hypothetical protein OCD70_22910 [Bacillus tropicus]|uniref:hypothetical protein n=1 Tax=Bacillus tropicus TaxID=2026188 RepID=UPI0021CF44A8|nr:hypothetical protein [Bacillus tropicus]MCU5002915.1 hypothetical protein [Bacillus tropicus]